MTAPLPTTPPAPHRLGAAGAALTLVLASASALALASGGTVSAAAGAPRTAPGSAGQQLTVSTASDLAPPGQTVRVTGKGYDPAKGVYVALCKDNGDDRLPAPCAGGADVTGAAKASQWIVPVGDAHAGELGTPYGAGGGFDVELRLTAKSEGLDCARVACSVVTRVDHRGVGDRSQDVRVPVAFRGGDAVGPGGEGVDVPQGTVAYAAVAQFTTAGKPRDVLLHPDSGKLYVGSEDLPDTAGANESGLHVLDPADGRLRGSVTRAPGSTGALSQRPVRQLIAPLPGDGVVFAYPLRGIGTAREGDSAAAGAWVPGAAVTDSAPGVTPGTVLVAQGPVLSEVDIATAAVKRTLTLDGGEEFALDAARGAVWFTDFGNRRMYRVDTAAFKVTAAVELPRGEGFGGFAEVDPETGAVWVGLDTSVVVHDAAGERVGTVEGQDLPRAARFDAAAHEAYVVWQDAGDPSRPGSDNNGALAVYRTADLKPAAKPVVLPGNHGQSGAASLAVQPGGGTLFVTNPAEGRIVRLERSVSPTVAQGPTDRTVTAGTVVSLTARAEGTPSPAVVWQVSTDAGKNWKAVPGATAATYAFTAAAAHDGQRYRAEFHNSAGTSRTTAITLTVTAPPDGSSTEGAGGTGSTGGTDASAGTSGTGGTAATGGGDGTVTAGAAGGSSDTTTGGTASGGTAGGGSGGATAAGGTTGGALASTGVTVASLGGAAVVLTAAGWALVRRRRPGGAA
ncbi:hypothetical protein GCM10010371_21840 [Streptomyces subrutilus]|uniref:Ig-like domain-containing protein n=1 Tax=Streptomyces subrutilus TaxID=36818 RepID=A0A5P2UJ95_9ACTN|nr:hypothetical protein [Streptomyces subrutilus]QEU77771.1 hypothetical protein CP968_05305 [Streptomyces subrutilus]GGZ62075.1 hypothetical protein GCM10010371_21840 [Streptomyces subrutilus]